ncbi:MAG: hypothetical protein RBS01_02100 [Candidatus Dojkabacteria bacterium]|jgi:hypothetical protein|nr:hypothetical protein [Candidatus Dojkabacteria bacterium]
MNVPKIKLKKINLSSFFKYILSVLISSLILALVLISLPLTERVTSSATYDLVNKKDYYWSKEYKLELDTSQSIRIDSDIEEVKSILHRRLRKIGVEESSLNLSKQGDTNFLVLTVQTSKDIDVVESLIKTPFLVNIVTRKADIDFENPEDVIAPYLLENYDPTPFTRTSFRNVYITQLKNSNNEYSYFALFKTWPWGNEWKTFLQENAGQTVGVALDEFVTPVQIPTDQSLFAVPVSSTEEKYAQAVSILYNSGQMPISYTVVDEKELDVDIAEIDYIKLTEGILIAVVLIYLYLLIINKTSRDTLLISGISTVLTVSTWIAYLKISETPTDIFILALEVITIVAMIRLIAENLESKMIVTVLLALISSISILMGSGYIKIFAYDLLILIILSNISLYISKYYLDNVKKSLKL